jgi:hypothetical protein
VGGEEGGGGGREGGAINWSSSLGVIRKWMSDNALAIEGATIWYIRSEFSSSQPWEGGGRELKPDERKDEKEVGVADEYSMSFLTPSKVSYISWVRLMSFASSTSCSIMWFQRRRCVESL